MKTTFAVHFMKTIASDINRVKSIMLAITAILIALPLCSQGKILEGQSIDSKILSRPVKYSIYLPEDYDYSQRSYPVLYLLHGYTDDETAWVQFGEIGRIADEAIQSGEAAPLIIVMPDAGVSFYINAYNEKQGFEDMFFNELIPTIEKKYRIRSKKEFRAVAGLSMGGYGTLVYGLKHPEMFAAAAPLSAAVFTDNEAYNNLKNNTVGLANIFGPLVNDSLPAYFKQNSPLNLVKTLPKEKIESVRWYIDCGDKDFLIAGNCYLHLAMRERDIKHEFRVRNGEHNWTYWRTAMPEVLKFISTSFHR
ncbi:MAG TPA: alpha/beta hydrolase family protein [Bacteroidales bacterium]|nr:alpha/beta hydrolase family protein [Bacteroidales bacterium]